MDKRIVFLSYYFEPDLCAGSFRNTSLLNELKHQIDDNTKIDVYTTLPNRYDTFKSEAKELEIHDKIRIFRISTPVHDNGMFGQMKAFKKYFKEASLLNKFFLSDPVKIYNGIDKISIPINNINKLSKEVKILAPHKIKKNNA